MNIYLRSVIVALILNVLLFALISSDFFWMEVLGIDGFYAGMISGLYVLLFIPFTAVLAGTIVALSSRQSRLHIFIVTTCASLLFSGVGVLMSKMLADQKLTDYFEENPLGRLDSDPLKPITVVSVEPPLLERKPGDGIEVVVYAHESITKNNILSVRVEVTEEVDVYRVAPNGQKVRDDKKRITEGYQADGLELSKEKSPDGRSVYRGIIQIPREVNVNARIRLVRAYFADYSADDVGGWINLYSSQE